MADSTNSVSPIPSDFPQKLTRRLNVLDLEMQKLTQQIHRQSFFQVSQGTLEKIEQITVLLPPESLSNGISPLTHHTQEKTDVQILYEIADTDYWSLLSPLLPQEKKAITQLQTVFTLQKKRFEEVNAKIKKSFENNAYFQDIIKKKLDTNLSAFLEVKTRLTEGKFLTAQQLLEFDIILQQTFSNYTPEKKTINGFPVFQGSTPLAKSEVKKWIIDLSTQEQRLKDIFKSLGTLLLRAKQAAPSSPPEEVSTPTDLQQKGAEAFLKADQLEAELPKWKRLQALGIVLSACGASAFMSVVLIRFRLLQKGLEGLKETRLAVLSQPLSRFLDKGTAFLTKINTSSLFAFSSFFPIFTLSLTMLAVNGKRSSQNQVWNQRIQGIIAYYQQVKLNHINKPELSRSATLIEIKAIAPENLLLKTLIEHYSSTIK
ncbi:MAG: hypothetical protein JSR80_01140 [Verrucomicrobia bacterium]|nr:hypothetical protein [Verrucomicrobiota bacterium]